MIMDMTNEYESSIILPIIILKKKKKNVMEPIFGQRNFIWALCTRFLLLNTRDFIKYKRLEI